MNSFLKEKEQELAALAEVISAYAGGDDTEADRALTALEKELPDHPYVIWNRAALLTGRGDFPQAKALLLKLLKHSPFYFAAHFSLISLLIAERDYKQAFYHYTHAIAYAETAEDRKFISEQLKSYIADLTQSGDMDFLNNAKELLAITQKVDTMSYTEFPVGDDGSMWRKKIFQGRSFKDYLVNAYKLSFIYSLGKEGMPLVKHELLEGDYCEGETQFEKSEGDMFAFSTMAKEKVTLEIILENRTAVKDFLSYHRFNYFNIPENGTVKLRSSEPYFISKQKAGKLTDKPELVINIFIQGLSFEFLKDAGFEKTMPNTAAFFSDYYVAERCMTAAEESMHACMSLSSGKYVANHGLVNYVWNYNAEEANTLIQEYFYDAGYMTARICGLYEMSPSYGYFKKNVRTLYAHNIGHFYADEVTAEAIEHLETFDKSSNFLWLSIQDLHDIEPGFDSDPLAAVYESELSDDYRPLQKRYLAQLKKIDFFLLNLYKYIERKYGKDDVVVALNSDVCPSFLFKNDMDKAVKELSVPFMLRARGAKGLDRNSLVSSIDIMPTLLDMCGIAANELVDGKSILSHKRELTYTDSIVPLKPYRAKIFDKDGLFTFETCEKTDVIAQANIFDYKASDCEDAKEEEYTKLVYNHMKNWIKL